MFKRSILSFLGTFCLFGIGNILGCTRHDSSTSSVPSVTAPVAAIENIETQTSSGDAPSVSEKSKKKSARTAQVKKMILTNSAHRTLAGVAEPILKTPAINASNVTPEQSVIPMKIVQDKNIQTWFWVGTNFQTQGLKHNMSPDVQSSFDSKAQPGISLRTGFSVNDVGVDIGYENSMQSVSSAIDATVVDGKYQYDTLNADGTWQVTEGLKVLAGVRRHTLPFLFPDSVSTSIFVRSLLMTSASVGVEYVSKISDSHRLEYGAAYEIPTDVSTLDRASASVTAKVNGHISLGYIYSINSYWRLALRGQYQVQSFDYKYKDTPASTEIVGDQTLQTMGAVLQIGVEY